MLEDSSGPEEYEVERVLRSRVVRGKEQLLVKWKGFGDFENSWEPVDNLANARERVAEFRMTAGTS